MKLECRILKQLFLSQGSQVHIQEARIQYQNHEVDVQLLKEVSATWSANLHLRLLAIGEDLGQFFAQLIGKKERPCSSCLNVLLRIMLVI